VVDLGRFAGEAIFRGGFTLRQNISKACHLSWTFSLQEYGSGVENFEDSGSSLKGC
jgi:hypothetical protein